MHRHQLMPPEHNREIHRRYLLIVLLLLLSCRWRHRSLSRRLFNTKNRRKSFISHSSDGASNKRDCRVFYCWWSKVRRTFLQFEIEACRIPQLRSLPIRCLEPQINSRLRLLSTQNYISSPNCTIAQRLNHFDEPPPTENCNRIGSSIAETTVTISLKRSHQTQSICDRFPRQQTISILFKLK